MGKSKAKPHAVRRVTGRELGDTPLLRRALRAGFAVRSGMLPPQSGFDSRLTSLALRDSCAVLRCAQSPE